MSYQFLNQIFQEHFNGGNTNGNRGFSIRSTDGCTDNQCNGSVPDGKEKRKLMKYKAIFIHYSGEEDNGMDSEVIQAYSYQEAYSIACKMPGRVYKLTEINL